MEELNSIDQTRVGGIAVGEYHCTCSILIISLVVGCALTACSVSYKFSSASIDYTKAKIIQTVDFPIRSSYVWGPMELMFNSELKDALANRTRLQQVRRNDDLKIEGEIVSYMQRNKSVSSEGHPAQTELTLTANVCFTSNVNHTEDFERQSSSAKPYETTQSLNPVQGELVSQMAKDLADRIFNMIVANWQFQAISSLQMDLARLTKHPEMMDKETLYDLRSLLALRPYYQMVKLLMLQNLYLLHNSSFNEELRRAVTYLIDWKVLSNLIEVAHYQLKRADKDKQNPQNQPVNDDRTISPIDDFLETIPADEEETSKRRKPTPADTAADYVVYLMEVEDSKEQQESSPSLHLKDQEPIDNFIKKSGGRYTQLNGIPEYLPGLREGDEDSEPDEGYLIGALAKAYIKQRRYERAVKIVQRLNLSYLKGSSYFADQSRFLEKLILNNKTNK